METILLTTITDLETKAVLNVFEKATEKRRENKIIDGKLYITLGSIGEINVVMFQAELGAAGSLKALNKAIDAIKPSAIIMVGVALGVVAKKQKLGDILVSQEVISYESSRAVKGEKVSSRPMVSSRYLLNQARSVALDWQESKVHFGLILTGQKLVDNLKFRDQLLDFVPEAIGADMGGMGLFAAAIDAKLDWIFVKAICDWADGNKNIEKTNAQNVAARKAALFVLSMIRLTNGLPPNLSSKPSALKLDDAGVGQSPPDRPNISASESSPLEPSLKPPEIIRQYAIQDDALEKHAATDKPIHDVEQDRLEFRTYVNALREFISSKYTSTPITISVDGPWGTGKSSLMYMLRGALDPQRDRVRKTYEWVLSVFPWLKWFVGFFLASPIKSFGKILVALVVRNDIDEPGIHLYFGKENPRFQNFVSDIVKGFSTDPELLEQPDNISMNKRVRWWANIYAKCESMQPRYHYAVWLNAWKFDNQEEVWASLALATMEQIKQKHNPFWRLWFWCDLTFSQFSFWSAIGQVFKQFLLPLLFALLACSYDVVIGSFDKPLTAFGQFGGTLLWAGFVVSGILKVADIFKDPFQISLDKVFDRPSYKEKVSFLAHFEKDFAKIVQSATKNGWGWQRSKLIIFIDDLDRCEPPKAADIVEAVNLFLDAEGCVFVVGMDSEAVAMSIEVKYKDLFERMRLESSGIVSLGRLFLDKIVQIPFTVPQPTNSQIMRMVEDSLPRIVLKKEVAPTAETPIQVENKTSSTPTPVAQPVESSTKESGTHIVEPHQPDVASLARTEVRDAIQHGAILLSDNPRQAKTFINLFRLSIYIANERKLLEERTVGSVTSGINLNTLAVWVACTVRWPNLVKHLNDETQTHSLRQHLASLSGKVLPNYSWDGEVFTKVKTDLAAIRTAQKDSVAHWCNLPWEWWLLEPDFVRMLKLLEKFWPPRKSDGLVDYLWDGPFQENEYDWLKDLLTMTKPISQ